MTVKYNEDSFNEQKIALDWICTIESEKGRIRETDIYPKLSAWLNHVAPQKIIEIGCGQGICSDHIDTKNRIYIGIDPSKILINRAKQLYFNSGRSFILGNIYALPFPNEYFDAAFSISVWHLLDDLKKAAEELSRILKSKGRFLIISANPGAYSLWTDLYEDQKLEGKRFEGMVQLKDNTFIREFLYLHTLEDITESLNSVHLKVRGIETFRVSERSMGQGQFVLIEGEKSY